MYKISFHNCIEFDNKNSICISYKPLWIVWTYWPGDLIKHRFDMFFLSELGSWAPLSWAQLMCVFCCANRKSLTCRPRECERHSWAYPEVLSKVKETHTFAVMRNRRCIRRKCREAKLRALGIPKNVANIRVSCVCFSRF